MKKFQKLLAMMLTVVMCVGTLADTGFTAFAAGAENDVVSEDDADDAEDAEEAVSSDEALVSEEATEAVPEEQEEDPAEDEPEDNGVVNRLIVNGVDMLKNKDVQVLENGSIPINKRDKDYMYYDSEKCTLTLNNITLDGTYGLNNTLKCSKGIDFKGDALNIDIVGNCKIYLDGVDGEETYGIYGDKWSNIYIRSTLDADSKFVKGYLTIFPAKNANAKWVSSIYCDGNLSIQTPASSVEEITDFTKSHNGLTVEVNADEVVRYGTGGEIEGNSDITIKDATVITYAAASAKDEFSCGIQCDDTLKINSGYVEAGVENFAVTEDSMAVAIRSIGNITIGEKAYVQANGNMLSAHGEGIISVTGQISVYGELEAWGKGNTAIYAGGTANPCIKLDGNAIYSPNEGKVDQSKHTITDYNGKVADYVWIRKGHYCDTWVGGRRLGTWDSDLSDYVSPMYTAKMFFDPELNTITMEKVTGISYYSGGPSEPEDKALIYTKKPMIIRGDAKLTNTGTVISSYEDLALQGEFELTSTKDNAIYVGAAELTIEGSKTVVKAESKNKSAIAVGADQSKLVIDGAVVSATGVRYGIYCDGDIEINGGEVNAKTSGSGSDDYAIVAYWKDSTGDLNEIKLKKGLDVVIPDGGQIKSAKDSIGRDVSTVVDKNGYIAKDVKIAEKKFDLWLGDTQVTSVNRDDILGDGKASYDPDTNTLNLNGVTSIPGKQSVIGTGDVLIYSKKALNIKGSADINSDYIAICIKSSSVMDTSTIEGSFTFNSSVASGAVFCNGILNIIGSSTKLIAKTQGICVDCYALLINEAVVNLVSEKNTALWATTVLSLVKCDLTAKGNEIALMVASTGNVLTMSDDLEIIEPEDGKTAVESGYTIITDSNGNHADKVRIANSSKKFRQSPMNPVPEGLDVVTELTLVKGQSFNMPGSGWKYVEKKTDKKFVSINSKGKLKAKKVTESGKPAKITDGTRTIEITVVRPAFSDNKPLKLNATGMPGTISLGFSTGSDDLPVWFTSSAPDVVAVYGDGIVWAKTAGNSTITAYVNGKAYTKKVKVTEPEPLTQRYIHATVNVKKTLKVKGFKVAEWVVSDTDKNYFDIKKTSIKPLKTGSYLLTGLDKTGAALCGVVLIVEDPTITNAAIKETKPNSNKYKINTDVGSIVFLTFDQMDQTVTFKSSNGAVAYADYNKDEKLVIYAQSKGKCKLTAKVNGKTITITVNVE